jgi:hypothetical protein
MEDYFIFDEKELARIGIVCAHCDTEIIFDLDKDQAINQTTNCPRCNKELFRLALTETPQQYAWISLYKRARDAQKQNITVRLYFRKSGLAVGIFNAKEPR